MLQDHLIKLLSHSLVIVNVLADIHVWLMSSDSNASMSKYELGADAITGVAHGAPGALFTHKKGKSRYDSPLEMGSVFS